MRAGLLLWTLLPFAAPARVFAEFGAEEGVVCSGDCVADFRQCAGKGFSAPRSCCNEDFDCFRKNASWSQCRRASTVPSSWDGQVLTCTDEGGPGGCEDPTAVTVKWFQVSAGAANNFQDGRNLGTLRQLDGCAEACADLDDCIAFSEYEFARGGERCELWAEGVIATEPFIDDIDNEPNLEPSLFTNISFVKCFEPPTLCDPEEEVRQVGSDTGPFFKYAEAGGGGFDRNRAESLTTSGSDADTLAACITVCRLSQSPPAFNDPLHCIGFALDVVEVDGAQRTACTLLYSAPELPGIFTEYTPTPDSRIFTLDDCPTSTELGQM